jgi:hypothetical protein
MYAPYSVGGMPGFAGYAGPLGHLAGGGLAAIPGGFPLAPAPAVFPPASTPSLLSPAGGINGHGINIPVAPQVRSGLDCPLKG